MTVSTTASSAYLLGNGVLTSFNFSFNNAVPTGQSTSEANYTVIYTSPTGVQTTLAPSTYSLTFTPAATGSIWGQGGVLTYPLVGSPIANGSTLTLTRTFPLQQTTTISNQGDFAPQVIEEMGDTLEMQIQQLNNRTTQWRGTWMSGVVYNPGDIVQDGSYGAGTNNYYLCVIGNTSGVWSTDLGNGDWTLSVQALIPVTNQPITLSGDVTGTGTTGIATTIAANAVTYAKFQQVAASSLLGNLGTATANATAIALTALGFSASINVQSFTSSATYTPTANMIFCIAVLGAQGGGGGGVSATNSTAAGGGGAGGVSAGFFTKAQIGSSQAVIIGSAAGNGGSNSGGNGATGSSTSIGILLNAVGGSGGHGNTSNGANAALGGAGGTGTFFSLATIGAPGNSSTSAYTNNAAYTSGLGGSTMLGGGGVGLAASASTSGNNGYANTGGGGGGAVSAGTGEVGGSGGSGFAFIIEFIS